MATAEQKMRPRRPLVNPNRRPVVDELGQIHPSCMHAAVARGISISAAYGKARLGRGGWRFAEPHEIEHLRASTQEA